MIILAPGGLGNQLFSVAAALHLAEFKKINIKVFSDNKELVKQFMKIRKIENHPKNVKMIFSRSRNLWINKLSSRIHILSVKIPCILELVRRKLLTSEIPWEFPYYLLDSKTKPPLVLRGYFQDSGLLENLSVKDTVFLTKLLGNEIPRNNGSVMQDNRSIGVHIRRGDFVLISDYGTLSTSYFQNIIAEVKSRGSKVFIASDDSDVLENFEGLENHEIISPHSYTPLQTMKKLSDTKHFIMSNSTFSFWIAWIVSLGGGTVYAPDPWFKKSQVPINYLYLDNFIRKPSVFEDAHVTQ